MIGETNAFIANIADSPLESADKLPMEAAARFLRALAYYNLAVTYGDVPLKTTPSAHDGVAVPRSPKMRSLNWYVLTGSSLMRIYRKR